MKILRDALTIFAAERTLFKRFPKLRISAIGIVFIPAIYALIYLSSVWDPTSRTGSLPAAIVNLDKGVTYRESTINIGQDVTASLRQKHSFGFTDVANLEAAKLAVREGRLAFALIIPADFSANAVPGATAAAGRLTLYVSEGNNYTAANIAKRFSDELSRQVNLNLNEKRWALVLSTSSNSLDKLAQLKKGVTQLQDGAHALSDGAGKAETGSAALAKGATALSAGVDQLSDGTKQLGAGLRTMDQRRPAAADLAALKAGAGELAAGHVALGTGLQKLEEGSQRLVEGAGKMRDETAKLPIVGGKISAGAGQLADGASELNKGLGSARSGQEKLSDGAQRLNSGVARLTDGVGMLGDGIHTMAGRLPPDAKLDELSKGGAALSGGAKSLQEALGKLGDGSRQLAGGLDLLNASLPADTKAPDGTARGLADSVEPVIEIVAPVANNGTGFAPNFLPVSLWLGAVMTAFLFHLRRLPAEAAAGASRPAQLLGKLGILCTLVVAQAIVVLLMSLFVLDLHVSRLVPFILTLLTTSVTFMLIILALVRAFGDAGKAAALLLLIFQLSSAGGILPVELSGGIFQQLSPWLPFTWAVKAFRASMFGAFDGNWLGIWLVLVLAAAIAWLFACFVGRWKLVGPEDHRPALDM